jgi:hypothetical protein
MKRIALGVLPLLLTGAALAEPPKKKTRQAAPQAASERWAAPTAAAEAGDAGAQTKWAAPELPPPDATEALGAMPAEASPSTGTRAEAAAQKAEAAANGAEAAPKALVASPPSAKAAEPPSTAPRAAPATAAPTKAAPVLAAPRSLLASMRAVALVEGEARVVLAEGERVLHPGDRLGVDTVRTVSEGVIVLDRTAGAGQPGGAATVLVRFDASGQAHVRVFHEQDPTPLQAPRMK